MIEEKDEVVLRIVTRRRRRGRERAGGQKATQRLTCCSRHQRSLRSSTAEVSASYISSAPTLLKSPMTSGGDKEALHGRPTEQATVQTPL